MPTQTKPQCPACHSQEIRYRRTDNLYWCRRCGHEWLKPAEKKEKNGR